MTMNIRRFVFGAPKDVKDPHAFHKLSLVALLAWVGLGADGLSSSAYGPDEAFRALGEHTGLAFFLSLAMTATVFIISYGYSRIIEQFPSGGGGYVVASRLLHERVGVVSGSALLVDYVLTITISIASGADAIFSFLPPSWTVLKLPISFLGIGLLTILNIRGVKESVTALVPIFGAFVVTHAVLLIVAIGGHLGDVGAVSSEVHANLSRTSSALGTLGLLKLFVHAYSMGGGTYTGIEAVSNGVGMMREPRVQTAQRTMVLMAVSLAVTAGGILLSYLLVHAAPVPGIGHARLQGLTLAGGWHLGALDLRGEADFVDARDSETGARLNRRAAHQFSLAANYTMGDWTFGAAVLQVGARPDGGVQLPEETTLDLKLRWQFAPRWSLEAKVINATDVDLQPVRDYQGLGRQAWIGLRFSGGL